MTSKQRLDWKNELAFIKMKTTKFLIDNTYLETEKRNPFQRNTITGTYVEMIRKEKLVDRMKYSDDEHFRNNVCYKKVMI